MHGAKAGGGRESKQALPHPDRKPIVQENLADYVSDGAVNPQQLATVHDRKQQDSEAVLMPKSSNLITCSGPTLPADERQPNQQPSAPLSPAAGTTSRPLTPTHAAHGFGGCIAVSAIDNHSVVPDRSPPATVRKDDASGTFHVRQVHGKPPVECAVTATELSLRSGSMLLPRPRSPHTAVRTPMQKQTSSCTSLNSHPATGPSTFQRGIAAASLTATTRPGPSLEVNRGLTHTPAVTCTAVSCAPDVQVALVRQSGSSLAKLDGGNAGSPQSLSDLHRMYLLHGEPEDVMDWHELQVRLLLFPWYCPPPPPGGFSSSL